MNQFTFTAREKSVLGGAIGLGVLCLVLTYLFDDAFHSRFWSNYLHNSTFFIGISFVALFALAAFTTAYAGWYVVMKRVWEAYSMYLLPGLVVFGVVLVGLFTHSHHLYHWSDHDAVVTDPILAHKSSFLNQWWYIIGTVVVVGTWIFFARQMYKLSTAEDQFGTTEYKYYRKYKIWSAAFLPIAGFSSAAIIWQWIMSIDAHWYSTLFAWYATASWFVSMMALTIMVLIYLKSRGYYENVTENHLHDLGKYLFAFSVFWTYLWFSQYMLIWYGNVGEETVYFQERQENYPVLFYGNLVMNFVLPFFVLMRNDTKRKFGTMFFAAMIVFFGHWWDFFQMIKPGVYITTQEALMHAGAHVADAAHAAGEAAAHGAEAAAGHGAEAGAHGGGAEEAHGPTGFVAGFTIPGLLEVGTFIGFLGGFLYFFFSQLAKAPLSPKNDPYLVEAEHHHVWPFE